MSKKIAMVSVGLMICAVVVLAFAGTALASYNSMTHTADHSMVAGSVHDVTRAIPGENPCDSCHIPHSSKGDFLWARSQNANGGGTVSATNDDTGVSTAIKPLCYSCHDGSGVNNGTGIATVFSTSYSNHRTRAATALNSSQKAYGAGRDCDLCHDPHDDGNTSFLKYERYSSKNGGQWSTITAGGNFCASCHSGNADMAKNHALEIAPGTNTALSHLPYDTLWVPASNDYSGTRLYDPTSHMKSTAANAVVECASCHTPHGAEPTAKAQTSTGEVFHSLNTMRTAPNANVLGGLIYLCINCH